MDKEQLIEELQRILDEEASGTVGTISTKINNLLKYANERQPFTNQEVEGNE